MRPPEKRFEALSLWAIRYVTLPMAQTSSIESRLREILQPKRRHAMLTRKTVILAALAAAALVAPLAALRPAAQAKPLSVTEVNALSAPGVEVIGGTKVQLAGVTDAGDAPGAAKPWWGPTGNVLPAPLLHKPWTHWGRLGLAVAPRYRAIAFKIVSPHGEPVTLDFLSPSGSLMSSSPGTWPGKTAEAVTESQIDAAQDGYRVLYVGYTTAVPVQSDIRLGIGAGPWKKTADNTLTTLGTLRTDYGRSLFSPLVAVKGGSVVVVSVERAMRPADSGEDTSDLRVVAVDAAGHERLPVQIGDNSSGTLDQITARFDLPPAAIKSVRLETRPFHWVTFRNVPLRPRS